MQYNVFPFLSLCFKNKQMLKLLTTTSCPFFWTINSFTGTFNSSVYQFLWRSFTRKALCTCMSLWGCTLCIMSSLDLSDVHCQWQGNNSVAGSAGCVHVCVRVRMHWRYHAADQRENESLKCLVYKVYCCCTAAQGLQRGPDLLPQHSSEILAAD